MPQTPSQPSPPIEKVIPPVNSPVEVDLENKLIEMGLNEASVNIIMDKSSILKEMDEKELDKEIKETVNNLLEVQELEENQINNPLGDAINTANLEITNDILTVEENEITPTPTPTPIPTPIVECGEGERPIDRNEIEQFLHNYFLKHVGLTKDCEIRQEQVGGNLNLAKLTEEQWKSKDQVGFGEVESYVINYAV